MRTSTRSARLHSDAYAGESEAAKSKLYTPRYFEHTLLYPTITGLFETRHTLASAGHFDRQGDPDPPKSFDRQIFWKFLKCGIFAQILQMLSSGASSANKVALHIDAIVCIHRFGFNVNKYVNFCDAATWLSRLRGRWGV